MRRDLELKLSYSNDRLKELELLVNCNQILAKETLEYVKNNNKFIFKSIDNRK